MTADEIKEYCKARLQEIEYINHVSHTPSAMVALAAFVGYLSRLAFWGRSVPNATKTKTQYIHKDEDAFNAFIEKFLPKYKKYYSTPQPSGAQNFIAKKYWLYVVLRCGLVHSMSFYDKWSPDKKPYPALPLAKPNVVVSHDSRCSNLDEPIRYTQDGYNAIVINAFDLCVDLKQAIEAMFRDQAVRDNAEQFVKYQPPIHGLSDDNSSDSENSASQQTMTTQATLAQETQSSVVVCSSKSELPQ